MPLTADAHGLVMGGNRLDDVARLRPVPKEELPAAVPAHDELPVW